MFKFLNIFNKKENIIKPSKSDNCTRTFKEGLGVECENCENLDSCIMLSSAFKIGIKEQSH